ncbi:MAG: hypothetical protein LBD55_05215 [Treponema sp.]|jgi:hypothetical protein|nr:hypothetical protein [Treponema sp.]
MRGLFYGAVAAYPVLMFCLLAVFKVPLRVCSLVIIALGLLCFLEATSKKKRKCPEQGYSVPCCS